MKSLIDISTNIENVEIYQRNYYNISFPLICYELPPRKCFALCKSYTHLHQRCHMFLNASYLFRFVYLLFQEKKYSKLHIFFLYEEIRRRQEFMITKIYKDLLNIFHWRIHLTSYVWTRDNIYVVLHIRCHKWRNIQLMPNNK